MESFPDQVRALFGSLVEELRREIREAKESKTELLQDLESLMREHQQAEERTNLQLDNVHHRLNELTWMIEQQKTDTTRLSESVVELQSEKEILRGKLDWAMKQNNEILRKLQRLEYTSSPATRQTIKSDGIPRRSLEESVPSKPQEVLSYQGPSSPRSMTFCADGGSSEAFTAQPLAAPLHQAVSSPDPLQAGRVIADAQVKRKRNVSSATLTKQSNPFKVPQLPIRSDKRRKWEANVTLPVTLDDTYGPADLQSQAHDNGRFQAFGDEHDSENIIVVMSSRDAATSPMSPKLSSITEHVEFATTFLGSFDTVRHSTEESATQQAACSTSATPEVLSTAPIPSQNTLPNQAEGTLIAQQATGAMQAGLCATTTTNQDSGEGDAFVRGNGRLRPNPRKSKWLQKWKKDEEEMQKKKKQGMEV